MREVISRTVLPSGEVWGEDYREPGGYVMDWKRAACFRISSDGLHIRTEIHPGAAPVSLKVLRRLAHAYAASLRGKEALHATGLIRHKQAIALLGASGEGKSTLAAKLMQGGWGLLSDDALPVLVQGSQVLASSLEPCLKISPKIIDKVNFLKYKKSYDSNLEKWIFSFPEPQGIFPLKALVLLSRQEKGHAITLKPMAGAKAALLLQASFYNEILRPKRVLKGQFRLAANMARALGVWELTYPTGLSQLSRVARTLEKLLS